ncbi:MAG: protein kinase domain-containing protein [Microcoleus sp.]
MIGQLLDRRYRIIKVTDSSEVGTTYLAADTHRRGSPQCLVRKMRLPGKSSQIPESVQTIFQRNAEKIEKLGKHHQIPELSAYFAENRSLYLIEELIAGEPLSTELIPGQPWTQKKIFGLLEEILEVLVFIHENGFIHGRIQPDNLIRRQSDRKWVLTDFRLDGELNSEIANCYLSLPTSSNSIKWSVAKKQSVVAKTVYTPMEQWEGNPRYNSDIYALGTIALVAVTGLSTLELASLQNQKQKINGGDRANCGVALADIIEKMVRSDFEERYQGATEVLADFKKIRRKIKVEPPLPTTITPAMSQPPLKPSQIILLSIAGTFSALILTAGLIYYWQTQDPARVTGIVRPGSTKGTARGQNRCDR